MSKTILTLEQEKEIVDKYLSGKSKNSLKNEYKVSEGTIGRALKRNNIHIRQVSETNISKYNINHSFFEKDNINSNSAYILGLIASDGCVSKVDNCISIELKSDDIELLEEVNKILENERPIKTYSREERNDTSKLYFFSKYNHETSNDTMEIDFLITKDSITNKHNIIPIEVKSGERYTYSSLNKLKNKYQDYLDKAIIVHNKDLKIENDILYLPIYMVSLL